MENIAFAAMLGQVIDPLSYVNPWKILVVVVLTLGWAAAVQWVDRDTDVVKTKREQWNMVVMGGSIVAYLVLFVPPWQGPLFFLGLGFWAVLLAGTLLAYVVHRNNRVVDTAKVLTPSHIQRLLAGEKKVKGPSDKGMQVRLEDHEGNFVSRPDETEQIYEFEATQEFIYDVFWRRATDADVLAGGEKYRVIYRVDGVPIEKPEGLEPEQGERVFRFLKRIAGLNEEEIRRPQSGTIKAGMLADTDLGKLEVQTSGTTAGERLRLHAVSSKQLMRIHELGMPDARLELLRQVLSKSTGLVIVSAPPQHGLTTTQYAILRAHDAYIQNIHTLERRRMLDLDNITQQIYDGSKAEVTYARMLQTVLRREPDVVMVSDMDERETAAIAARAGADDRKIYLGVHAKDGFDALAKFVKSADDNDLASRALLAVINQRLLRILCEECREAFKPDPAMLKKLNLPADKIDMLHRPPTEPLVDKKGREIICQNCQGTGYVGRTGVFEILLVDDSVRQLIAEGAPINRIKNQCRQNKMYYLQEEALLKVIDGTTSMNEVIRALKDASK